MPEYPNTPDNRIFVFGSNLAGVHGAGAAKFALDYRGAILGRGVGPQGQSFAIPTKDENINSLSLDEIAAFAIYFTVYAAQRPDVRFQLTAVGCGLAGFTNEQIVPMFLDVPDNVDWPPEWKDFEDLRTPVTQEEATLHQMAVDAHAVDMEVITI